MIQGIREYEIRIKSQEWGLIPENIKDQKGGPLLLNIPLLSKIMTSEGLRSQDQKTIIVEIPESLSFDLQGVRQVVKFKPAAGGKYIIHKNSGTTSGTDSDLESDDLMGNSGVRGSNNS